MKKIDAIVRPNMVASVLSGLEDVVYESMTLSNVYAHGYGLEIRKQWMGNAYSVEPPRVKIELLVDDSDVDRTVLIIARRAHTGVAGDGSIAVLQVDSFTSVAEAAAWGRAAS